jgi:hypothetical protein
MSTNINVKLTVVASGAPTNHDCWMVHGDCTRTPVRPTSIILENCKPRKNNMTWSGKMNLQMGNEEKHRICEVFNMK